MRRYLLAGLLAFAWTPGPPGTPDSSGASGRTPVAGLRFSVPFPPARSGAPLDGRLLILIATDTTTEPRFQVSDNVTTAQVYGMDVDGWKAGQSLVVSRQSLGVYGYPIRDLSSLPKGRYRVQALLTRYETFHRTHGHTDRKSTRLNSSHVSESRM